MSYKPCRRRWRGFYDTDNRYLNLAEFGKDPKRYCIKYKEVEVCLSILIF